MSSSKKPSHFARGFLRLSFTSMSLLLLCSMITVMTTFVLGFSRFGASQREVASNREIAPTTGRYVPAADVDIFIQESGPADGETLVFIHGTGAWGEIFREMMEQLNAAGYQTVALDLPPFGFSDRPVANNYDRDEQAERIISVIDALEVDGVTLVGHSFGGGPTVEAALMAPEKINRLILLDVGNVVGLLPFEDRPTEPGLVGRVAGIT
ncbi:MAG: alpha/beta fold hydrolase, partial [Chloroflexota bacterium]